MLKSSIAVLKKKTPNTRRRDRKDAEGKGRGWGGQRGKAGVYEVEGGRNRNGRQVADSLELLRTRQVPPRERLFLSSFE